MRFEFSENDVFDLIFLLDNSVGLLADDKTPKPFRTQTKNAIIRIAKKIVTYHTYMSVENAKQLDGIDEIIENFDSGEYD